MSILNILNELTNDNSRLAKEAILKREINNDTLRDVFKATYDPMINYWQVKIPSYTRNSKSTFCLKEAMRQLNTLTTRKVTGNAAIEYLTTVLSYCEPDDAEVIERVIGRDLRCGVGVPTINKIWPGLIPEFEVMLAHKDISGIKYPAICQTKMDGMRVHMYFDGSDVQAFTRNGKQVELKGVFQNTAKHLMKEGEVWDGELLCHDGQKFLDRKTGNGICNKGVKGTISQAEADMLMFVTWDIVDFSSTKTYQDRWHTLEDRFAVPFTDGKFYKVASVIVSSIEDVDYWYNEAIAHGEEGVIVKNINSVWQGKRTKDLGKVKAEEEADLKVTGWVEGTGKYKGLLGALTCTTSDDKLEVNVGTGWSDEDRKTITEDVIGSILTVKYNQKISDKKTGKFSLFLPRAVEFRNDKNVANSVEELK